MKLHELHIDQFRAGVVGKGEPVAALAEFDDQRNLLRAGDIDSFLARPDPRRPVVLRRRKIIWKNVWIVQHARHQCAD